MRAGVISMFIIFILVGCTTSNQHEVQKPTVQTLDSPAGESSSLPYLVKGNDGKLYMSWVNEENDSTFLRYSVFENGTWSSPELIKIGTDWFVNWADYPMMSINKKGEMLAHYLAKSSAGTYSYDVNITRNNLNEWTEAIIPHNDGTPTEHGFLSMIPLPDNSFQLAWLDGRNTSSDGDGHHGAMSIRSAVMDIEGNLSKETELDNRVCDCCQTGAAITSKGPVVVYRDRSETEVRDMSIVRLVNGAWTEPKTIYQDNWEIAGCPVNGPRVDAIGDNLAIAWFSSPNNNPQVKVIFSNDAGESFGDPVMVDNMSPFGRVDVVMIDPGKAIVSWLGRDGEDTVIKTRVVKSNGTYEPVITIAKSQEARGSGFPQMAAYNNKIFFAWTELSENSAAVRVAALEI
ncbi:MAG: exo-alpha-sialidase [bacterium]|nr:exo-alpha-sialidase [bacterium]